MRVKVAIISLFSFIAGLAVSIPAHADTTSQNPPIPVVILGGSAAAGWHDKTMQGYVERGLKSYAKFEHVSYTWEQHAHAGARVINPLDASRYHEWMQETPGGVVVLAWGFLNDIRLHTPMTAIVQAERTQIAGALSTGHTVIVLSPPATEATFTFDREPEANIWAKVARVAIGFHSPKVHVIDVMDPMERYIVANHQTYRPYMQGKWDPNTAGHILAGRIFAEQLEVQTLARIGLLHRNGANTAGYAMNSQGLSFGARVVQFIRSSL